MKLISAIKLGEECGLETIEECLHNVSMHSLSLFIYEKLGDELIELELDVERLAKKYDSTVENVENWTIKEFNHYEK